jgi:hypothetical protein
MVVKLWFLSRLQALPESIAHLLVHSSFTRRFWGIMKSFLGLNFLDTDAWAMQPISEWLSIMPKHKDFSSIILLASWEIWNGSMCFPQKKNTRSLLPFFLR